MVCVSSYCSYRNWMEKIMRLRLILFIVYDCIGIEPWTFVQKLGDAVLIPAGCPHQVRNLKVDAVCLSTII